MSNAVASQRCFNHALREAALRCPGCKRYFCRECASEHEGRYLCAACIRLATPEKKDPRRWLRPLSAGFTVLAAVLALWATFYLGGYILLQVPSETHTPKPSLLDEDL